MNPSQGSCLLLVEDDPDDVVFIRRGFEKAGIGDHVRLARDGEEAIAYLKGEGRYKDRALYPFPALMVFDLKLPKKSGLEILAWLRSEPRLKDLPVIIFTSSKEPTDIARAQELGVAAYHLKPVEFKELIELVRSIGLFWITLMKRPEAPGTRG